MPLRGMELQERKHKKDYTILKICFDRKWKKKEVEPVEPVLKNIYQSNTYRKDLSWPHFNNEPRVQEKQHVKDQQSCISIFVACLKNPSINWGHQPRRDNSISYMGVS